MAKRSISWKENKVISVETRRSLFVLAQMLRDPYIRFYNTFQTNEDWKSIDLKNCKTLFTVTVTRQFLKCSNISYIKEVQADIDREDLSIWIHQKDGFREIKVWPKTELEKEFIILGSEPGGDLVEKDIWWQPTSKNPTRNHPSGVFDSLLKKDIPLDADDIINKYELTNLSTYPGLNERLYLCNLLNKNVNPYKDLVFDKEISLDYKVAIDIISTKGDIEEKERILNTFFR